MKELKKTSLFFEYQVKILQRYFLIWFHKGINEIVLEDFDFFCEISKRFAIKHGKSC